MIRLIGLALAVAMLGACVSTVRPTTGGNAASNASTASLARTSCPSDQQTPEFAPAAPSDRNLAIVWLKGGGNKYVVRAITDINHPTTVSTLPFREQFVSASDLTYIDGDHLYRAPLSGAPGSPVTRICWGASPEVAWTRNGTTAAYMTLSFDNSRSELHVVSGGHDRMLATAPAYPWGVGCEGAPGQHCEDLDDRTLYSPDGAYISFVENWGGPVLRIWTSDGKLVKAIDGIPNGYRSGPTMSVWSGSSFYWRDSAGVHVWRDGKESLFLPGVAWIGPKASPVGGRIVYEARDGSDVSSVYELDTGTGTGKLVAKLRTAPAFLTSRYIWYQEERLCSASDKNDYCSAAASDARVATWATGKSFIYDLQTGVESESMISYVWDVWPHPA